MFQRPEIDEYDPYYTRYINNVPEGNIIDILSKQCDETLELLQSLSDEQTNFRYGEDKWSIKGVIGHVADTERVMAYRLLCIARGETNSLPGFNDQMYAQNAHFDQQSMTELLDNFISVRKATIHLLKGLVPEDGLRKGLANQSPVTVRAIAYIIAGHAYHHCQIIQDRYMGASLFPQK